MNKNQISEFFNDVDSKFLQLNRLDEEISDTIETNLFGLICIEDEQHLINTEISSLEYIDFCEKNWKITGLLLFHSNYHR